MRYYADRVVHTGNRKALVLCLSISLSVCLSVCLTDLTRRTLKLTPRGSTRRTRPLYISSLLSDGRHTRNVYYAEECRSLYLTLTDDLQWTSYLVCPVTCK